MVLIEPEGWLINWSGRTHIGLVYGCSLAWLYTPRIGPYDLTQEQQQT